MTTMFTATIFLLFVNLVFGETPCCDGPTNELEGEICANGFNLTGLICPEKLILNPANDTDDDFEIVDDELFIKALEFSVPPDSYCIGKSSENQTDVALVCVNYESPELEEMVDTLRVTSVIKAVCHIFSFICHTTTIFVYFCLLRLQDMESVAIMHLLAGLTFMHLFFAITLLTPNSEPFCTMIAFAIYFCWLFGLFWLNILSFFMWKMVVRPLMGTARQWKFIYFGYGYGMPILLLVAVSFVHYGPGPQTPISETNCWFEDTDGWTYFYGPVSVLMVVSVGLFVWTAKRLWVSVDRRYQSSKITSYRFKYTFHLLIFLTIAENWVCEIFAFIFMDIQLWHIYFWEILDCKNIVLEGAVIYLTLVVYRRRIRKELIETNSTIYCVDFPERWINLRDEESFEDAFHSSQNISTSGVL